jgi:hypothetical protein
MSELAGRPPLPPRIPRAALAGSPKSQGDLEPHQISEVASALQERKIRRLHSFRQRTASTIARAVYETAEPEQTRKIEASLREYAEARG